MALRYIPAIDPELASAIDAELERQRDSIELIASENFVSLAVLEAAGTVLTNKYAEGLPGKRYYGGCEKVDVVENLARERAKALFGAEHANVQPHAGAPANLAAFYAFMQPGDTYLGMNLAMGGHLTHGSPVNFSGKWFNVVPYGLGPDERIDYDEVERLAREHRPKMIIAGASAYPRVIDFERFAAIAAEVGAKLMVDMAHIAGLVATGAHPSPVPYADVVTSTTHKTLRGPRSGLILCKAEHQVAIDKAVFPGLQGGPLEHIIAAKAVAFHEAAQPSFKTYIDAVVVNARVMGEAMVEGGLRLVSGGTDNHLLLVDLRPAQVTGKDAERLLEDVGFTVNKNAIPNDPESPFVTSGIRVGSAAITTRGFDADEARCVGRLIAETIFKRDEPARLEAIKAEVAGLLAAHPLYPELIPAAKVGHVGLYRDPETLQPVEYYCKLPEDIRERDVMIVDPMLATGGSAAAAVQFLRDRGAREISLLVLIAAPEGIDELNRATSGVTIYTCAVDSHLNDHGYIVPGLGDAGDRLFGTK